MHEVLVIRLGGLSLPRKSVVRLTDRPDMTLDRVRTEIGYQNSRTFPRLFKDYLPIFQESFFIDSNSPNTAYTQAFCSIEDRKRISLSSSLFLPDFSSSYRLRTLLSFLPFPISALRGFTSGCIRFVLLESYRIE